MQLKKPRFLRLFCCAWLFRILRLRTNRRRIKWQRKILHIFAEPLIPTIGYFAFCDCGLTAVGYNGRSNTPGQTSPPVYGVHGGIGQ